MRNTNLFLLLFLFFTCTSCKHELPTCQSFRTGKFLIAMENDIIPDAYIVRQDFVQIEKMEGIDSITQKVEWVSECSYHLSTVGNVKNKSSDLDILIVTITQTTETGYEFIVSERESNGLALKGIAKKLD